MDCVKTQTTPSPSELSSISFTMSSRSRSSSSQRTDSGSDGSSDEETVPSQKTEVDIKSFAFCKTHIPGQMDKTCPQCSIALSVVTDPILLSRLFGDTEGTSMSDMKSRFGKRCDEVVPTMNLDADTMATVEQLLSQGQFHSKGIWNDVVKKHLTLPMTQHKSLTDDLKNEDVFNKLRHEHCYKNVFKYQGEIRDCLRNYRLASRPIFSLVQILNKQLSVVRKFGVQMGLEFPDSPPGRSGVNVPRDTGETPNNLAFSSDKNVIPTPDLSELFDSLNLDPEDENRIINVIEDYRLDVGKLLVDFYKSVSEALNNMDDHVIFHFHLYGHCDATMKELLRSKILCLLKDDVKHEVMNSLKKPGESSGTLCGGTH